jgi:hypothetical protein
LDEECIVTVREQIAEIAMQKKVAYICTTLTTALMKELKRHFPRYIPSKNVLFAVSFPDE